MAQNMSETEQREIRAAFTQNVNLTAAQLTEWLQTEQAQQVRQRDNGGESTGHRSGRRIPRILEKHAADYSDADYTHMRQVNGYIARHLAQRPASDVTDTPWRWSLMNWGHDPLA